jgi:hypothetical protein
MLSRSEYSHVFRLLDEHSRRKHQCFVTEMIPSGASDEYLVCFRPVGGTEFSADRFSCRYVRFETLNLRMAHVAEGLLAETIEELDQSLREIGREKS